MKTSLQVCRKWFLSSVIAQTWNIYVFLSMSKIIQGILKKHKFWVTFVLFQIFCLFMFTFYQIMMRWYKLHTEGITVKSFLQMLIKWKITGFIDSYVWSNLDDMINSENIESAVCDFSQHSKEDAKLSLEDNSDGKLLACVAHLCVRFSYPAFRSWYTGATFENLQYSRIWSQGWQRPNELDGMSMVLLQAKLIYYSKCIFSICSQIGCS